MERLDTVDIVASKQGGTLTLAGDLKASDATKLEEWFQLLEIFETPQRLELGELDIIDGVAATHMLNIVRLILNRCGHATLAGAPQSLAHNLYRAGLLFEGCAIMLEGMREDEPHG